MTVLFADVVHSMDIAAAVGAERLRVIMAELFSRSTAVVQRYGGTVDQFTGERVVAFGGRSRERTYLRTYLSELSPWLMIAIGFVFFAAVSAICRYGLGGVASPERRDQVEEHAGKLLSVLGATFAFLIGFAITITWSAVGAGQDAVDLQASSAQQLSWAASEIHDKAGADEVNRNLRDYLNTVVNKDLSALAAGDFTALPSAETFDTLQNSVHKVAYGGGNTDPEANGMVRRLRL